jgi:hypothetical protein
MATLADALRGYVPPTDSPMSDVVTNYANNIAPQAQANLLRQAGNVQNAIEVTPDLHLQVKDPQAFNQFMSEVPNMAGMAEIPLSRKEIIAKELENISPNVIKIGQKEIPVTMHPIEIKEGNQLINVNTKPFDEAFKNTEWQYIDKNAEGGKKERIEGVKKYLESGKPLNASNVVVKDNGAIVFGDGRHRYVVLRDTGLGKIPMSMDEKSIENAKKFGYVD